MTDKPARPGTQPGATPPGPAPDPPQDARADAAGAPLVEADTDVCIGAGQCVMTAPDVFDQRDEDGVVVVLTPRPAPADVAAAREAVALCPSGALTLREG